MQQTAPAEPRTSSNEDSAASSLVEGLIELNGYYATRPSEPTQLGETERLLLVGLARHRFQPLGSQFLSARGQVMVFGGAGAGKSTTVNILAGEDVAEVNTQAGFTRHPTAIYLPRNDAPMELWPDRLGMLQRSDRQESGNLDVDCYSTKIPSGPSANAEFLRKFVLWDCPDLTTRDATYYASRVVEIAALADLCIYVASDERYNDELPTQFFQSVLDAGKPTIVVMTKMSPLDVDEFIALFRQQVVALSRHPENVMDVSAIPAPMAGKVADLWSDAYPHGQRLREMVTRCLDDLELVRHRASLATLELLKDRQDQLLKPLEVDVHQWRTWSELVRRACEAAITRYQKEFLDRSIGADSQESLQTLLAALSLPGRGALIWRALEYLRAPYRILKAIARKYIDRRSVGDVDEEPILESARTQLLDSLIVAVATRRQSHPFWEELHQSLLHPERIPSNSIFREIHARQAREIRLKNREASDRLEERFARASRIVWTMRVFRLIMDLGAVCAGFYIAHWLLGGWSVWSMGFVLLSLGIVDDAVRVVGQELVRRQREEIVRQRKHNIRELIQKSYADVLLELPKGLSEQLARLSKICERMPKTIDSLLSRLRAEGRP